MNRDSLRKITLLGFHLLGAVLIILMITSMFVGGPTIISESENTENVMLTPKSTVGVKNGVNDVNQQFEYDLSKIEIGSNSLIFYTCHQNIQVYADDKEIYSVKKRDGMFGGTTGARWNYVDIPSGTVNMKVTGGTFGGGIKCQQDPSSTKLTGTVNLTITDALKSKASGFDNVTVQ